MTFLPANYEVPAANERYLKFKEDGDYRFRVLGSAIIGMQLWIDHKPLRKRMDDAFTLEERELADAERMTIPRHFWAFPVWHDGMVKILQVEQVTIQRAIQGLVSDEEWGDPKNYDIVVSRRKEGSKVSYSVVPKPAAPLSPAGKASWKEALEAGFDLNRLYSGGDPFTGPVASVEEADEQVPEAPRRETLKAAIRSTVAKPDEEPLPEPAEGEEE